MPGADDELARNQEFIPPADAERLIARDSASGQFTSKADAAARPGETQIEDVGTVAALRLALAAACDWIEQLRSDAPPLEVLEADQLATWRALLE